MGTDCKSDYAKNIMKNLKTTNFFLGFLLIISCQNKSVKEDITERFPSQKIDTILDFDFDKNGVKDNISLLVSPNRENSIALYMNNKFVSINDKVIPKSILGWEHFINLENRNNELIINDNFSTTRPKTYYKLIFNYNKNLNKIVLDSFVMEGRIEDETDMPYFKNFVKKKVLQSETLFIENGNFLTRDSLDFKKF